jgi:hypothetical protein
MTLEEYVPTYPNYCRICKGWGVFKGFTPGLHIEDCSSCLGKDTCPRCAGETLDVGLYECSRCHWNRDDKARGLPGSNAV